MPQYALIEGQVSTAPSFPSLSAFPLHPLLDLFTPLKSLHHQHLPTAPPHTHKPHPFKLSQHFTSIPFPPFSFPNILKKPPAESPPLPPPTHKADTHLTLPYPSYLPLIHNSSIPTLPHPCQSHPTKYPACSMLMMRLWERDE